MRRSVRRWVFVAIVGVLCAGSRAFGQTAPSPAASPEPASTSKPAEGLASRKAAESPTITSISPTFFVLTDSPGDNTGAKTAVSIGVADEIRKAMHTFPQTGDPPWIIPEPSWDAKTLGDQCHDDPKAIGGVIITYYAGAASHFFLIYQEETLTFALTAQVIACNYPQGASVATPTVVAVIAELPGSRGTPWIVRRSQVSVPLVSFAGLAAIGSKGTISTKNNDATSTAIIASLFTQASSRDVPGYSTPLKMRYGSQHIGVDLLRAMRDVCAPSTPAAPAADRTPLTNLCSYLDFTTDPDKIAEQQHALDVYEANLKAGKAQGGDNPPQP